ncbi:maltase A2 isoform X2 [Contarinia nasturtii]|uniref:maltase A2 isoform X2 n=1 Tax=Contarinia nasturtii TaxID=265458 RepID=UPI0012D37DA6|nr:maltase A2 isoform X2 [Contarinia nasturtii]
MDETKRNSMKLDVEAVRLSENDHDRPTEVYKQVSEFDSNDKSTDQPATIMTREKNDTIEDGADEKMLGVDDKEQLARKDEVKFIPSDRSNGDAKIDIGNIEKSTFSGMTKDELMKYANDPFWQRLRWTFFVLFWLLWAAMLAAAIFIILKAPKCSVDKPLEWYKEGPLVVMPKEHSYTKADSQLIEKLQSIDAKGVIYNLPADKTYSVGTDLVDKYIIGIVDGFKNTSIKVILDLTPNYVTTENALYKLALSNETYRSAFIWVEREWQPNNWLSKVEPQKSAWKLVGSKHYVLNQFGENNIDLQLNDPIAKANFTGVLRHLVKLGVKGFRLANAKHYIIDRSIPNDGTIATNSKAVHSDYEFWTHNATTYQPGIGKLLHEFWQVVKNETNGEGFLSVTDYIEHPEKFSTDGNMTIGFDLPIVVNLTSTLSDDSTKPMAAKLKERLSTLNNTQMLTKNRDVGLQWPYENPEQNNLKIGTSEYNIFLFLLPGVPVGTLNDFIGTTTNATVEIKKLEDIRKTQSYQHGTFEVYTALNETVIAYSRLKSGTPGYFVVYNPTADKVTVDFSFVKSLPEQLTVELFSKPYENTVDKVPTNAIPLQESSAVIFKYAPKSAE